MIRADLLKAGGIAALAVVLVIVAARSFAPPPPPRASEPAAAASPPPGLAVATFAGGCFWCMEPPFDRIEGVVSTTSGYTGGSRRNPTYGDVSAGATGHAEAVRVIFDPQRVSYQRLLGVFWLNIDPTVDDRQFCDVGSQYRAAIFYHDAEQQRLAEGSREALKRHKPFAAEIRTRIAPAGEFWPAEDAHQDYYLKNPVRYRVYRAGCGRDARLHEIWGDIERRDAPP